MSRTILFAALLLPAVALADGAPVSLTPEATPAPVAPAPAVSDRTAGSLGKDPLPPGLVPDHLEPFGAPLPGEILTPKHERRRGMPAS